MENPTVKSGEWILLEVHMPMHTPRRIGVLLREKESDRLHIKLRPAWWRDLEDGQEAEIWRELDQDLSAKAAELGGEQLIEWLATASHFIQISNRTELQFVDVHAILDRLYTDYVRVTPGASISDFGKHAYVFLRSYTAKIPRRLIRFRLVLPTDLITRISVLVTATAALLLQVFISHYHHESSRLSKTSVRLEVPASLVELPPAYCNFYPRLLPNIHTDSDPGTWNFRERKAPHKRTPAHGRMKLSPLKVLIVNLPVSKHRGTLDISPPELLSQSTPLQMSFLEPISLPRVSPFKAGRNRVFRALAIVSNPLKTFFFSVFSRRVSS